MYPLVTKVLKIPWSWAILAEGFGLHVSLGEVERAIEELSMRGLVAIRSAFTAFVFVITYTRMTVGLTALGRQTAHKLAARRNMN